MRGALHTQLDATSRYELLVKIASGGMATVYVGHPKDAPHTLLAIKRAHPHLLEDPSFRRAIIAEARLASSIHHPNVVRVYAVEEQGEDLLLIMEYIEGASLSELLVASDAQARLLPPPIALRILIDACAGLQAAYQALDENGQPLCLVHRDVSPQNILIGIDGIARLTDFGVAKGIDSTNMTATGALKGKLAYMPPEYIEGRPFDHRGDLFSMGVVAWETLAGQRLFRGANEVETMRRVVETIVPPLSTVAPWLGDTFDAAVAHALERLPHARFASARDFATALEHAAARLGPIASPAEVGDHVFSLLRKALSKRRQIIQDRLATAHGPTSPPTPSAPPLPRFASSDDEGATDEDVRTIALPAQRRLPGPPTPWPPAFTPTPGSLPHAPGAWPPAFTPTPGSLPHAPAVATPHETSAPGDSGVSSHGLYQSTSNASIPGRAAESRRLPWPAIAAATAALGVLIAGGFGLHKLQQNPAATPDASAPSASPLTPPPTPPTASAASAAPSPTPPVASAAPPTASAAPSAQATAPPTQRPTTHAPTTLKPRAPAPKPTIAPNPYRTQHR